MNGGYPEKEQHRIICSEMSGFKTFFEVKQCKVEQPKRKTVKGKKFLSISRIESEGKIGVENFSQQPLSHNVYVREPHKIRHYLDVRLRLPDIISDVLCLG